MAIEIGSINADTSVKLGTTTIQSGYIGFKQFYNTYTSILDLYPSAYHAHSLRKLKSTYTGFCLRIRRTTTTPTITTTTVDLGFDVYNTISMNSPVSVVSGLGTTLAKTLGEFAIGAVDGFTEHSVINVVTWYDQSGSMHLTQGNAGNQPRLVRLDSGVATLETTNSKVAVRFIAANLTRLQFSTTAITLNNVSSYVLGNSINSNGSFYQILATPRFYLPNNNFISYNTANTFSGIGSIVGIRKLFELVCGTTITNAYANGNNLTPTAGVSSVSNASTSIRLGLVSTLYAEGYIQEAISFVGTSNRTQIETDINTYYTVW